MPDPKIQIQELISLGKTEEALAALEQLSSDAILLQARFNGAKKQYNMGLIEFSEWSRIQAQINYSALESLKGIKMGNEGGGLTQAPANGSHPTSNAPMVFITHSTTAANDIETALRIKTYFEARGTRVRTTDDIPVGANIEQAVNDFIKSAKMVLIVISKESLQSNWESGEIALDLALERVAETKVIPVTLDRKVLDPDFYFESMDKLNENISKYQNYVQKALTSGGQIQAFQNEFNRLQNAKHQLGLIIEKLKSVRLVSLSRTTNPETEAEFEAGMGRIYNRFQTSAN